VPVKLIIKFQLNDCPLSLINILICCIALLSGGSLNGETIPQTTEGGQPLVEWRNCSPMQYLWFSQRWLWRVSSGITPRSPLKVNRRFGGTCGFHLQGRRLSQAELSLPPAFTLVSCLAYSSTLKMEATSSSEKSVDFERTTRRYIPEHRTLVY
jgi:hypothetical protein